MLYDFKIPLSLIEKFIMDNLKTCLEEYSDCAIKEIENDDLEIIFPSEQSWIAFASTASEEIFHSLHDLRYQLNKQLALSDTL